MVETKVQLSRAAGANASELASPAILLHCKRALSAPEMVVITGAVLSITEIVCTKLALVLPQASVKFQVRTRTKALEQFMLGVETSLTK